MTKADLLERVAFWETGLMDVDHLRDVAYEAMSGGFDVQEFRQIAGDARLSTENAREFLLRALRAAGMEPPSREIAERIVCLSVTRSILAGEIDPLWGAHFIADLHSLAESSWEQISPLIGYSCPCCNGLDEMVGAANRAARRALCRQEIRDHLQKILPEIETWAGVPPPVGREKPAFLGWRRPLESKRAELKDLDRKIRWVLLRFWDPIGVSQAPEAKSEYDGCIPGIQRLLLAPGTDEEVATALLACLQSIEGKDMGIEDGEVPANRREETVEELLALRSSW